jgi:glycosyltransferase involved in cell wall biosynthesis
MGRHGDSANVLRPGGAAGPLRVLLAAHRLGEGHRGGTEQYCLHLGGALAAQGLEVTCLAPAGPPAEAGEAIPWRESRWRGSRLVEFARCNPDFTAIRQAGFERALEAILERYPQDIVHFHHTFLSSLSLMEVALNRGLPVVVTLHDSWHLCPRVHPYTAAGACPGPDSLERCATDLESDIGPLPPEGKRRLAGLLAQRLDYVRSLLDRCLVLAPSHYWRDTHYRYNVAQGRIRVWPLGLKPFAPRPRPLERPPRLVFLGNLLPVKRLDTALEAFFPLEGQAVLEVWGQAYPPWRDRILADIARRPHIRYRGAYGPEDLPEIFAGATATILPSAWESYSFVARESLMAGVPVLAARVGPLPEIIHHGVNGLLFSPGNSGELRELVLRLLHSPSLGQRLRAGIKPVRTIDQDAADLAHLYEQVRGGGGQGPRAPAPSPTPPPPTP